MSCISPGSVFGAAFSAAFTGMLHRGCANSQRGEDIGVDNRRYVRRRVSGLSIEAHSYGPRLQVRLRPPGRWIFLPARGIWRRASRRGEAGLAHRRRDRSFDRTATVRREGNRPLSGQVKMDDARQPLRATNVLRRAVRRRLSGGPSPAVSLHPPGLVVVRLHLLAVAYAAHHGLAGPATGRRQ